MGLGLLRSFGQEQGFFFFRNAFLGVARPAPRGYPGCLHAGDQVEEGVRGDVAGRHGDLLAVALVALDGPQEVEGTNRTPAAKGGKELRRDPRKLIAVLDEDRQNLVVALKLGDDGILEELLNESVRHGGAFRCAPRVRVVLHPNLCGTPLEHNKRHGDLATANCHFGSTPRVQDIGAPVACLWNVPGMRSPPPHRAGFRFMHQRQGVCSPSMAPQ